MATEISVIVPIWNTGAYAKAAVDSLLAQHFRDFEALLIDDGSVDGSALQAFAAAGGDPRFRLLRQPNRGLSQARNRGLDLATGRFIAFLDGDDRFAPDFLARMRAALLQDGGDWVSCDFVDCFPDGSCRPQSSTAAAGVSGEPAAGLAGQTPQRWPLASPGQIFRHSPAAWNKLWRRSFIGAQRFEADTWFEDHAFTLQAALRSRWLLHLPAPLYLQSRGRPGQITATDSERIFDQFAVLDRLQELLSGAGHGAPDPDFSRLTSRLLAERSTALRTPWRRHRWLRAARLHLSQRGLSFHPPAGPALAAALSGRPAVCLVADLRFCPRLDDGFIDSLAGQDIAAFSLLCICDAGRADPEGLSVLRTRCADRPFQQHLLPCGAGAAELWRLALAAAPGAEAFLFLTPGDRLAPEALRLLADARSRAGADLAVSAYTAASDGRLRAGFGDPDALHEAPDEGRLLRPSPDRLPFEPLAPVHLITGAALRAALPDPASPWPEADLARRLACNRAQAVWIRAPVVRPGLRAELSGGRFRNAVLAHLADLPPDLRRQSLSRALRLLRDFGFNLRSRRGRSGFALCLLRFWLPLRFSRGLVRGLAGPPDPAFPRRLWFVLPKAGAAPRRSLQTADQP